MARQKNETDSSEGTGSGNVNVSKNESGSGSSSGSGYGSGSGSGSGSGVDSLDPTGVNASSVEETEVKKKILVCIPYLKAGAQGNELELAVAGWKRHFKEDFVLVIVGDDEPFMEGDDQIIHLPHTCVANGNPPLDIIQKMLLVINRFPEYQGMVWANDDMYAINNFDLNDVKLLKCIGLLAGDANSSNHFQRNMAKTAKVLKDAGKSLWNYATHLPVYYEFEKLLELIEMHNLEKESHLVGSLYFNTFFPDRIPLKLDITFDNFKCGIYRPNPNMDIVRAAFKNKIWINNSQSGYVPDVMSLISKHYAR